MNVLEGGNQVCACALSIGGKRLLKVHIIDVWVHIYRVPMSEYIPHQCPIRDVIPNVILDRSHSVGVFLGVKLPKLSLYLLLQLGNSHVGGGHHDHFSEVGFCSKVSFHIHKQSEAFIKVW